MNRFKQLAPFLLVLVILFIGKFSFAHGGKSHPAKDTVLQKAGTEVAKPGQNTQVSPFRSDSEFPNLHPLVVHFPIVLIIVAALMQVFGIFSYSRPYHLAITLILIAGSLSGYLASSVFHAHAGDLPPAINALFEDHEKWAFYAVRLSALAAVIKLLSLFLSPKKWMESLIAVLAITAAVSVAISGHHGAELVHKYNIGPKGNYLESHH